MDELAACVLDASVAMVWGLDDETDPYADAILDRMPDIQAHVPGIWRSEVANTLLVGERRKRLTPADTTQFLTILGTFPITVDEQTAANAFHDTIQLARAHGISAYDATYLELAIRLGLPLATLDGKLKAAAVAAGVPLYALP